MSTRSRRPSPLPASDWPPYPPPASYPLTPSAYPPPTAAMVPEASEIERASSFGQLSTSLRERRAQNTSRTTRRVSAALSVPSAPRPSNAHLPNGEDDGADLSDEESGCVYQELPRRAHSHEPRGSSPQPRRASPQSRSHHDHGRGHGHTHHHGHHNGPPPPGAPQVLPPQGSYVPRATPLATPDVSAVLVRMEAALGRLVAEVGAMRSELGTLRTEVEGLRRERK